MTNSKDPTDKNIFYNNVAITKSDAMFLNKKGFLLKFDESALCISAEINLKQELFYKIDQNNIYLFDSFYYFDELQNTPQSELKSSNFFINNFTYPPGITGINNIYRIIPGRTYTWNGKNLSCQSIPIKQFKDQNYGEQLEDILSKVMMSRLQSDGSIKDSEIGVLFSGGIDSILLVQCLLYNNIKPVLITAVSLKGFDSSAIDAHRSKILADYWGLSHYLAEAPLDENSMMNCWNYLRRSAPMAVHTGIFFEAAFKEAKRLGLKVLFSGQNADTFYNLGPTSKLSFNKSDIADTFRRFFLSDFFIHSLPHKSQLEGVLDKIRRVPSKTILFLGVKILNFLTPNQKVYVPQNIEEAVTAYKNRPDYIIFPNDNDLKEAEVIESQGFFEDIYSYKVEGFVMTGAPQVIYSYGNKYDIDVMLPYSSEEIISTFFNMPKKLLNVLSPKKEIYKSSERLDKNLPRFPVNHDFASDYPSYHEWLIQNWSFIKDINASGQSELNNAGDFMHELSRFWTK
ncbi:asparagine synthase-related protein [Gammaproteobacteria bacterium]|nr:asparagine synthase-related protein [Gammaproteobacteria bacterium]